MSPVKPSPEPSALRATALRIFDEAMDACSIEQAFRAKVVAHGDCPHVFHLQGAEEIDLSAVVRVLAIAMGKGAVAMTRSLLAHVAVATHATVEGILIAPESPAIVPGGFAFFAGGHPLPNEQSFAAARAVQRMLKEAAADVRAGQTFCFFLVSGGASAMMELPLDPAISLEDTVRFHQALVGSGASIAEINCVRKHFSAVKGGRLAQMLGGVHSLTLAVSDVPAGRLDTLASGPTLPDPSTVEECRHVLERHRLLERFPAPVRDFFAAASLPETPKPDALAVPLYPLLSSRDLAEAASRSAASRGFVPVIDNTCDDWEASEASAYLLRRLRALSVEHRRVCLISTGEVTVRLPALDHGVGGRNLHFALACALRMHPQESFAILSAGSDGVDGNSPAAGAVVDASTTAGRIAEAEHALQRFDSFPFLHAAGCAILTGPTGNNIRDLRLLLSARP